MRKAVIFCIFSVLSISYLYAQDATVKLTATGQGTDKNAATINALRSAIEQAFGTFVSSDLSILNDEVVRDEIATVASGNIKSYKELSYTILHDDSVVVSVEAIVSPKSLTSWSESKGIKVDVDGGLFAIDRRMREINKKNELIVLQNLQHIAEIMAPDVFDTEVKFETYRETNTKGLYELPITLTFKKNKACEEYMKLIVSTLRSVSMSENEVEDYKKTNSDYYHICFNESKEVANYGGADINAFECCLRSERADISNFFKKVFFSPVNEKILFLETKDGGFAIPLELNALNGPIQLFVQQKSYRFSLSHGISTTSYTLPMDSAYAPPYENVIWPFMSMLPKELFNEFAADYAKKASRYSSAGFNKDILGGVRSRESAIDGVMSFDIKPTVDEETLFSIKSISVRPKEKPIEKSLDKKDGEVIPYQLIGARPTFQNGDLNVFSNWVQQNLHYPERAKENGLHGRVVVHFTVRSDGSVSNVGVTRGVDSLLDNEAVRVVSMSPKWEPGRQKNGETVSVNVTLPVVF